MAGNIPENNNINNAAERMAPDRQPEERSEKFDAAVARENLDRINRPREFKESSRATVPSVGSASASALSDDDNNNHLNKFFSEIDREKLGKIQELINIIFEKNPEEGVAEAKKLNDPYILDELEKLLTTEWMHKELVRRGLLPESK